MEPDRFLDQLSGMDVNTYRAPYSFREIPDFPADDLGNIFTVMDARCALCAKGAAWIARHDHAEEFSIVPIQTELGRALLAHYGLDPDDPVSWLYVVDGLAYTSLDAFMSVGLRFGGVWTALSILRILPPRFQDILYKMIARNRYRLFGSANLCNLPDPAVQKRLYI